MRKLKLLVEHQITAKLRDALRQKSSQNKFLVSNLDIQRNSFSLLVFTFPKTCLHIQENQDSYTWHIYKVSEPINCSSDTNLRYVNKGVFFRSYFKWLPWFNFNSCLHHSNKKPTWTSLYNNKQLLVDPYHTISNAQNSNWMRTHTRGSRRLTSNQNLQD